MSATMSLCSSSVSFSDEIVEFPAFGRTNGCKWTFEENDNHHSIFHYSQCVDCYFPRRIINEIESCWRAEQTSETRRSAEALKRSGFYALIARNNCKMTLATVAICIKSMYNDFYEGRMFLPRRKCGRRATAIRTTWNHSSPRSRETPFRHP